MNFIGNYANLTGQRIGPFYVEGMVGRNASGAPCWRIIHEVEDCGCPQMVEHSRLVLLLQGRGTQISLHCANPACEFSRQTRQIETVEQFRKHERNEAIAASEAQEVSTREQARKRIADSRLAALKEQYRAYWLHQIKTDIEESRIASFVRWCELSDTTRQEIVDLCHADSTVRIQGF